MSRQSSMNGDVADFRGNMDILTVIDPSCLKIPYRSNKINNNPRSSKISNISLLSSPEEPNAAEKAKDDVKIEIRRIETHRASPVDDNSVLSISGFLIPLGYIFFPLSLALCNLFLNSSVSGPVCILFSPVAMLSLSAHAITLQSPLMSVGLLGSAWLLPFACSSWSFSVTLWYIGIVGVSLLIAQFKTPALILSIFLFISLASSTPTMVIYHGIESQWGVSISIFLVVVLAVSSSLHLARVTFKIKSVA